MNMLKSLWETVTHDGLHWLVLLIVVVVGCQWLAGYDIAVYANTLVNLMWAALALYVTIKVLRYMHKGLVGSFRDDVFAKIQEQPVALAIYFGLQFVGVAFLIGRAFS